MTQPRHSRPPSSPTLCLEQLEERRLLNGAVWWVMPLAGDGAGASFKPNARHESFQHSWSLTDQLLVAFPHGKTDLPAAATKASSHEVEARIGQFLGRAAEDTGVSLGLVRPTSGDHPHGGPNHTSVDDSGSPTAQLLAADPGHNSKPSVAGKHENAHGTASGLDELFARLKDDAGADAVSSKIQPAKEHASASPQASATPAQDKDHDSSAHGTGSGGTAGAAHGATGGSSGGQGNTGGSSGAGGSQGNSKGNGTGKWWSHKGSGDTPPPAHHGGAQGGSHAPPPVAKPGHSGTPSDSGSTTDSSQSGPDTTPDAEDAAADQARGLALVLWGADGSTNTHSSAPVSEVSHEAGAAEPRGAMIAVKLDDGADTTDEVRLNGHPLPAALAEGNLELRTPLAAQPAASPASPGVTAKSFEFIVAADGNTPPVLPADGTVEGCKSPADLLALGLEETQQAMKQLLDQLAQFGQEAAGALARHGIGPWLVAAATGAVAVEIARRRLRAQPRPILVSATQASTSTWFPGLLD